MVNGASTDVDLPALTARLAGLRDELRILIGSPPVSGDIAKRIGSRRRRVVRMAARRIIPGSFESLTNGGN
jgi:hypothetical protein